MELVTEEISNALRSLSIPQREFSQVPSIEGERLYKELVAHFVVGGDRRWWWEAFAIPSASREFTDGKGFERITELVPDPVEVVWFVVEDDQMPFYPIYEATPAAIQRVIAECYGFEYYLVPKSRAWLLCENHHNRMIGLGEEITTRLESCNA